MSKSQSHADIVDDLAEEFVDRYRNGERPPVSEFAARCPERADEIRELFPALVVMEQAARPATDDSQTADHNQQKLEIRQLGDFRIIREVGRGGMGIVYEAEQVSLGRRVALKVLPKQALLDSKHKQRFLREAKAAARLHHTNIVPVFGVGQQDGLHYYVMQFIHGLGLDEVLVELQRLRQESTEVKGQELRGAQAVSAVAVAQSLVSGHFERTLPVDDESDQPSAVSDQQPDDDIPSLTTHHSPPLATDNAQRSTGGHTDTVVGQLSDTFPGQSEHTSKHHSRTVYWQSVARIGLQAAQALQYAHDQGIIHRDIKPGNLLLDARGSVWVTDFGLAKAADQQDLTHTGDVLGTLRYMAPEQFEGKADARSDVCSLGLTLYELLCLKPAFDERDRHKLIKQVTTATPDRLRSIDHHIPKDLETIVHKAIDRDASHRYQTAGELAADLQRYLGDEPIRARWVSPVTRFTRWCKRNPAIAVLTTVIAILLIAVAIGSSLAAVNYQALADEKTGLAGELAGALGDAEHNLELVREQEQIARQNLTRANNEQQRAEGNLDLALAALDAVYLDAIGQEKLLGDPISRPQAGDADFSPSARPPLNDLEKELLQRGLRFYDQFTQQNAATPRAAVQTAQAYYRVGLLQAALGEHSAAASAYQAAVERFERLTREDPENVHYFRQLADSYQGLGNSLPDWPDAKEAFLKSQSAWSSAIQLSPEDPDLYVKRAGISNVFGDEEQRFDDLMKALDLDSDNIQLLQKCSELYLYTSLSARRDQDKALELAERAVSIAPDNPDCHKRLARSYSVAQDSIGGGPDVMRDPERALEHFNRAVELVPDRADLLQARGHFFLRIYEYDRSLQDLNLALERSPDNKGALLDRAQIFLQRGAFDAALRDLSQAQRTNQHDAGIHQSIAEAYFAQKKWPEALDAWNRAIEIRPGYSIWYKRRAAVHAEMGQYDAALDDLRMAFKLNPRDTSMLWMHVRYAKESPEFREGFLQLADHAVEQSPITALAYADRGWAYSVLASHDGEQAGFAKADADFARAVEIDPNSYHAWGTWGRSLEMRGLLQQAREKFTRAVEAEPDHWVWWADLARSNSQLGDFAAAIQNYTRVLEFYPTSEEYWNHRGMCYHRLQQHAQARDDYSRAIELNASMPAFWANRALSCLNLQDYEAAISDASQAIELKPDHVLALRWRAKAHVALEQWDAAIADYSRLIELEPNERAHRLHCGRARLALGDTAGAEADFDAYLQPFNKAVDDNEIDWQVWNRRGVALSNVARWEAALADFDKAAEIAPERPILQKNRQAVFVALARWADAADALANLVESGAAGWRDEYELALLALGADQPSRYREACERMMQSTTEQTDPLSTNFAAWTCALGPNAIDDYAPAIALATQAQEAQPENDQFLTTLGAILYRAGEYQRALTQLTTHTERMDDPSRSDQGSPAYCWYFLAMTQHALGNADAAQTWLKKANEWTDAVLADTNDQAAWNRELTLQRLRDEANSLVGAATSDSASPRDSAERPPAPPGRRPSERPQEETPE